jgi:hypothetical protein
VERHTVSNFPDNTGKFVDFGPPKNVPNGQRRKGKIIEEVWAESPSVGSPHSQGHAPDCWGDYGYCAQLIEWNKGGHSIRFAYYRRSCGSEKWVCASQTTVEANPSEIKSLCERTLAKTAWLTKKPPTHSN